ncbi:MAG: hypothetical protein Q9201_006280 [Fulgogasparrea decipioides]
MHLPVRTYLPILLFLLPSNLAVTAPRATCAHPPSDNPPKFVDCEHVISYVGRMTKETGNPLYTASYRESSNIHLPNVFWDHLPKSTCGVKLDMVIGLEEASDELRLSEIAYAARTITDQCLEKSSTLAAALEGRTVGWMRAGKNGFVNITVGRLHWDEERNLTAGEGAEVLRLPNRTVTVDIGSSVD